MARVFFSLLLAKKCRRLVAIDRALPALASLRRNLRYHGIDGKVQLIQGDLGSTPILRKLMPHSPSSQAGSACLVEKDNEETNSIAAPDVLVMDPGQNGVPKPFRRFVYRLRVPRIVYVSGLRPLLRDCVLFERRGYKLHALVPFDSYPHTGRTEIVASLRWHGVGETHVMQ